MKRLTSVIKYSPSKVLSHMLIFSDGEGEVERPPSEDEAPPQTRIIESDDEEIPSTPQPEKK